MIGDDLGFRRTVLALRDFGLPYILEARHMVSSYEDPRHDLLHGRKRPVAVSDGTSFWRKADSLHC
jgi:hypothetical protein